MSAFLSNLQTDRIISHEAPTTLQLYNASIAGKDSEMNTGKKWIVKDENSILELLADLYRDLSEMCLDIAGARPGFLVAFSLVFGTSLVRAFI